MIIERLAKWIGEYERLRAVSLKDLKGDAKKEHLEYMGRVGDIVDVYSHRLRCPHKHGGKSPCKFFA